MKDWDDELAAVWTEIAALVEAEEKRKATGLRALVAAKVAVLQTELDLERLHERIRRLVSKELLLLPREKALQHWGKIWLDAAERFAALRRSQMTEALWLKLIRTRLGSAAAEGMDGEDLVSLSVRRANLAKTERYLEESLATLKERRRELTRRFRQREIVAANRAAAASVAIRLGASPEAASRGPEMAALNAYFLLATEPLHRTAASAKARAGAAKLDEKAATLLGAAKRMALSRERPSAKALDRYRTALDHLSDLELETREAYAALRERTPAVDLPHIVVQESAKNAKNV